MIIIIMIFMIMIMINIKLFHTYTKTKISTRFSINANYYKHYSSKFSVVMVVLIFFSKRFFAVFSAVKFSRIILKTANK